MPSKSEDQVAVNGSEFATLNMGKIEVQDFAIKEEVEESDAVDVGGKNIYSEAGSYPVDLPLEVITTIEPFNYAYPYLKNMSNGVLTHRNIFTEQEREVLKKIVDRYRDIVDTRSRTREIYMEKQNVWQQIVEEYNNTENILVRTEKELKKCWDNMKYRARLAEKEQLKVESRCASSLRKSPDPHQIACNAVQAALQKMLTMQTQNVNGEENCTDEAQSSASNYIYGGKDNWNSLSDSVDEQKFSPNGDFADDSDREDENFDDLYEDEQPALKKARQESPKLSSILLGDAKKSTYLTAEASISRNNFTIPNCTKVTHIMKKCRKPRASNLVSILPKGLNECVSILNIPNPNQPASNSVPNCASSSIHEVCSNGPDSISSGAINIGGGITISPQRTNGLPSATETSNSSQTNPMPYLKKMIPNKNSKKGLKLASNDNCLFETSFRSHHVSNEMLPETREATGSHLEERILLQRLEFDSKEHCLRMKVLEKQLQSYTNESQFWALKTKLLKTGHVEESENMLNGDI